MADRDPAEVIARICDWQRHNPASGQKYDYVPTGVFNVVPINHHPNAKQVDVPGVVLHAWSGYRTFQVFARTPGYG